MRDNRQKWEHRKFKVDIKDLLLLLLLFTTKKEKHWIRLPGEVVFFVS